MYERKTLTKEEASQLFKAGGTTIKTKTNKKGGD